MAPTDFHLLTRHYPGEEAVREIVEGVYRQLGAFPIWPLYDPFNPPWTLDPELFRQAREDVAALLTDTGDEALAWARQRLAEALASGVVDERSLAALGRGRARRARRAGRGGGPLSEGCVRGHGEGGSPCPARDGQRIRGRS
jgi:hypothetical protein